MLNPFSLSGIAITKGDKPTICRTKFHNSPGFPCVSDYHA